MAPYRVPHCCECTQDEVAQVWCDAQENLVDEVAGMDTIANGKIQHKVTAALSNSFGFGGHNSCVVFGPWSNGSA